MDKSFIDEKLYFAKNKFTNKNTNFSVFYRKCLPTPSPSSSLLSISLLFPFLKNIDLFYLKGKVGKRDRKIFHLQVYSLNCLNSQGWTRQKPGTWKSTQFSCVGGRGLNLSHFQFFPRKQSGQDLKQGSCGILLL